jgi:hypothetical protein
LVCCSAWSTTRRSGLTGCGAWRQGYRLHKTRRVDPRATDYGTYQLIPEKGKAKDFESIDAVEKFLTR